MAQRTGGAYRRINGSLTEKPLVTGPSSGATPEVYQVTALVE